MIGHFFFRVLMIFKAASWLRVVQYIDTPFLDIDVAHVTRPIATSFLTSLILTTWLNFAGKFFVSLPQKLYLNFCVTLGFFRVNTSVIEEGFQFNLSVVGNFVSAFCSRLLSFGF